MMSSEAYQQALDAFLASDDFEEALIDATRASWGGSGYSIELFADGHYQVLWDNQIGNLYVSPGIILGIPTLDDSDLTDFCREREEEDLATGKAFDHGYWEEEYFRLTIENDADDLKKEMRERLDF